MSWAGAGWGSPCRSGAATAPSAASPIEVREADLIDGLEHLWPRMITFEIDPRAPKQTRPQVRSRPMTLLTIGAARAVSTPVPVRAADSQRAHVAVDSLEPGQDRVVDDLDEARQAIRALAPMMSPIGARYRKGRGRPTNTLLAIETWSTAREGQLGAAYL